MNQEQEVINLIIADSDFELEQIASLQFQELDYAMQKVTTGQQLLTELENQEYELLLLGTNLSDMTAEAVIERLPGEIPFIIMIDYDQSQQAVKMLDLGAEDYLIKDYNLTELAPRVIKKTVQKIIKNKAKNNKLKGCSQNLRGKEKQLRQVINLSDNYIFIRDYEGNYLLANSNYAEFMGLTADQLQEKNIKQLEALTQQEAERSLAEDRQVINNNQRKEIKERVVNSSGEEKIFQTTKIPFKEQGEVYLLGVARDVTKLRKREEQIKEQKQKLESSYQEIKSLLHKQEKVIELTSNLTPANYKSEQEFLSQILKTAIEVVEEADCGSVYRFTDGKVEFVDAVGHDLDLLQDLNLDADLFSNIAGEVNVIDNILDFGREKIEENKWQQLQKASLPINQSIVFGLGLEEEAIGGVSIEISQKKGGQFNLQSWSVLRAFRSLAVSFYTMQRFSQMQKEFQKQIVSSMIKMLEIHDDYTKGHSENVSQLARQIAEELDLDADQVEKTYWAGMIHDIGKTVVPKRILTKKDRLTDEEYEQIKKHPVWGYDTLKNSQQLEDIALYVRHHHERWDGNGYPDGLEGDNIPLISQILTVADAWDAMRSNRPYREALPWEVAYQEIKDNQGHQFSPQVVKAFLEIKGNS